MEAMRVRAEVELSDATLRQPCRKVLVSLQEHWEGLTRFVDAPQIPMDNKASQRRLRGPAVGRKNYYGSAAVWSGPLAAMLFTLLATLQPWPINPRPWLRWYRDACVAAAGRAPEAAATCLPWHLSAAQREALQEPAGGLRPARSGRQFGTAPAGSPNDGKLQPAR